MGLWTAPSAARARKTRAKLRFAASTTSRWDVSQCWVPTCPKTQETLAGPPLARRRCLGRKSSANCEGGPGCGFGNTTALSLRDVVAHLKDKYSASAIRLLSQRRFDAVQLLLNEAVCRALVHGVVLDTEQFSGDLGAPATASTLHAAIWTQQKCLRSGISNETEDTIWARATAGPPPIRRRLVRIVMQSLVLRSRVNAMLGAWFVCSAVGCLFGWTIA